MSVTKMAGICSLNPTTLMTLKRIHGIRCCSGATENENKSQTRTKTPQILKLAVSGVTELLRVFSFSGKERLEKVNNKDRDEISVSGIDDLIMILKSDYEKAYFVTGVFTSEIYDEDCIFEDPTIKFQGTKLYSRNLKLLVPFFDCPSIGLQNIEKGVNSETDFVLARWKLRCLNWFPNIPETPMEPLISIDGSTVYELDNKLKIVRHAESWNVSALEAIGQIFTPSFDRPGE
ncbi:Adenine phosphoribosyltransferase protein [Salix suchowensis]|nr:Adenine phosphoribosyltransferase protein [Salix suchowensis]